MSSLRKLEKTIYVRRRYNTEILLAIRCESNSVHSAYPAIFVIKPSSEALDLTESVEQILWSSGEIFSWPARRALVKHKTQVSYAVDPNGGGPLAAYIMNSQVTVAHDACDMNLMMISDKDVRKNITEGEALEENVKNRSVMEQLCSTVADVETTCHERPPHQNDVKAAHINSGIARILFDAKGDALSEYSVDHSDTSSPTEQASQEATDSDPMDEFSSWVVDNEELKESELLASASSSLFVHVGYSTWDSFITYLSYSDEYIESF
uniref:Lipin_N domain-containing protein n=1 Tax=Angiostrongylus cantonensis TaxID=6313 RepID=A0A158P8V1_ANGCA